MAESAALAVDIGGTSTRVAVVRGTELLERREMPTQAQHGPDDLILRLLALLDGLNAERLPVGVACTGRVHSGLVSAVNTATMPGWVNIPLQARLADALGTRVAVLNDAKAATVAEWHASPQDGNFMFVTVSTGIGSGLFLSGQLHDTPDGRDVGLGFTRGLNGEFLEYGSSGRGLEKVAASSGFAGVSALFDAAEMGDEGARALLSPPLLALARRIADAHCLLGLTRVCLGGSVGLRPYTQEVLQGQLPTLHVQPAAHGADAGLIGAAAYVSEHRALGQG